MKNKAFYNTIKSSLLMDQVLNKYDSYRRTYFGSLDYDYDFTESIKEYTDADVWTDQTKEGLYKRNSENTYKLDKGLRFSGVGKTRRMGLVAIKECSEIKVKFRIDSCTATGNASLVDFFPWDTANNRNLTVQYFLVGDNVVNCKVQINGGNLIDLKNYTIGADKTLTLTIKKVNNNLYYVNGVKIVVDNPKYTTNDKLLGFNVTSASKADITSIDYTIQSIVYK